jgi:hypothetical protein
MIIESKDKQYNKSAIFLLPMLDINLNAFSNFYNVYYKTIFNNDERIYVVYKDISIDTNNIISRSRFYITNYDVDGFKVYIFKIPNEYTDDFKLFYNGKYNSFSTRFKEVLLKTYKIKKGELNKILNSLPEDRKALADKFDVKIEDINEVFPIPDEIEETFSISNNYKLEI